VPDRAGPARVIVCARDPDHAYCGICGITIYRCIYAHHRLDLWKGREGSKDIAGTVIR